MGAVQTSPVTRGEIIDDAVKILREQGVVKEPTNFWEVDDPRTPEGVADLYGVVDDPGPCRVCAAGAIDLALVRRGLPIRHGYKLGLGYSDVATVASDLNGSLTGVLMQGEDATVELLEALR